MNSLGSLLHWRPYHPLKGHLEMGWPLGVITGTRDLYSKSVGQDAKCPRSVGKSRLVRHCAAQTPRGPSEKHSGQGSGGKPFRIKRAWDKGGIRPQAPWLPGTEWKAAGSGRLWLAGTQTEVAVGKEMPEPEHQMWILGMKEQKGGEGSRKADHDNLWGRRI